MFRNTPYSSARGALCLFWATGFAVRRQGMRRLRSAQFSGERNQLLHTALRHAHSPRSFLDGKWCVRDVDFGLHGYALSVAVLLALMNTRPAVRPHGTRAPSSQRQEQPVASCGAWYARPPRNLLDGRARPRILSDCCTASAAGEAVTLSMCAAGLNCPTTDS